MNCDCCNCNCCYLGENKMADWNSVPEDFGSVEVDYANLHSGNLLAKSDFTDEHKDELVQLGEKLGVSVDSSLELSEMIDSLNETIKTIEIIEEVE